MERHNFVVRQIASLIRTLYSRQEPYRIFHGSTNSTRPAHLKKHVQTIDISPLRNVLSVDSSTLTALVEPNVPMDRLVEATLPHGLVPPVVMEFPGITAGGGFNGTAGESSSFRWGYFDQSVRRVEMVLPDGEVVDAFPSSESEKEKEGKGKYADLFSGAAGAVGTLGVTTLLELNLIKAKRFVKVRYRRTNSLAEAIRVVREECQRRDNDYVDGILYSRNHGVIVSGTLTDTPPDPQKGEQIQTFSGAWDPWHYLHVQNQTRNQSLVTEHIPLAEYLFRYDRGGFWVGAAAFDYFRPFVPFTRFWRWLLDDFLHTRMLYRALHSSNAPFFVQDCALPYDSAEPFVDYVDKKLGIWPLWLCPLKTPQGPTFHPHLRGGSGGADGTMLNIGVWGWGPKTKDAFVKANHDLEAQVDELGGMKWLYAHTYYSEPEFWSAYGSPGWYEALREKYHATSLPSVYDKVRVKDTAPETGWKAWLKSTWPFGGLIGIVRAIQSRDYMLHRNAGWRWKAEAEKEKVL